jgi:hypothetical protein
MLLGHSDGVRLCLAVKRALLPVTYVSSVATLLVDLVTRKYNLNSLYFSHSYAVRLDHLMAGRSSLSSGPSLRGSPKGAHPLGRSSSPPSLRRLRALHLASLPGALASPMACPLQGLHQLFPPASPQSPFSIIRRGRGNMPHTAGP